MNNRQDLKFDAQTVPLSGTNLIEASAGTGKTYSIAILVLRLIIEKQFSINEILMVTYTKAAVAELQERIRRFVRDANKYCNGEEIEDKIIKDIVDENILKDEETIKDNLRNAVLSLDETAVLTIHSFCQQALTEFAFETKQIFDAEAQTDFSSAMNNEVNKFWRKYVTGINEGILKLVLNSGFSIDSINEIIKEHFRGKPFYAFKENEDYSFCDTDFEKWEAEIDETNKAIDEITLKAEDYIKSNRSEIIKNCDKNHNAKISFSPLINNEKEFFQMVKSKCDTIYVNKLFPQLIEYHNEICELDEKLDILIISIKNVLFCLAISFVKKGVEEYKLQNNYYAFDDMILNLHSALMGSDNVKLISALQKKYKAVFVDEFQDTDKLQYEIFREAFMNNSVVFFIGDPKQSIYAFRNADITTYFEARKSVDNIYGMNTNFRSSQIYTNGLNNFFGIEDPFYYKDCKDELKYISVETPSEKSQLFLKNNNNSDTPFSVLKFTNKPDIHKAVAELVNTILDGKRYLICKNGTEKAIVPSDIGIIVSSNSEGNNIKKELAKRGIPSITVDDKKILETDEAKFLLYLLLAIDIFSLKNINQALLNPITGITSDEILNINEEKCVELFRKYRIKWEEDGLYSSLMLFASDFDIRNRLAKMESESGERLLTNFFQLIELVHKVQRRKSLSNAETINWLKMAIKGAGDNKSDEFLQRIESDENSVNIVTIHRSKGLAYNIVILPDPDFTSALKKRKILNFKNEEGIYISKPKNLLDGKEIELFKQQEEQEFRRLIYVAATRAVFKCFIFKNKGENTAIAQFLNLPSNLLDRIDVSHFNNDYKYSKSRKNKVAVINEASNFNLKNNFWQRTSYSNLTPTHSIAAKERKNKFLNEYDEFVFKSLPAGKNTGNMLHYIFENLNFSKSKNWDESLLDAAKKFHPGKDDVFYENLKRLPYEVLNTSISDEKSSFILKDVLFSKRISEFEFDFPLPVINSSEINGLTENELIINVRNIAELEGIMNGKIDFFFEHNQKFYVLDWKSNFLGDSISDYSYEKLKSAMNENNYHLQYLIYTLAIIKFLKTRKKDFDYERDFGGVFYLFVRGIRIGEESGIFFTKPSIEIINKLKNIFG